MEKNKSKIAKTIPRDQTIDRLRASAIILVIIIHVLYWGCFFTGSNGMVVKSLILFEMPVFFFVIGASYSLSKPTSYGHYLIKKIKRVLVPYWIFILFCFVFIIFMGYHDSWKQWALLIPFHEPFFSDPYLHGALWFLSPYLAITMVLPFFSLLYRKWRTSLLRYLPFLFLIAFILLSDLLHIPTSMFKGWVLYGIFTHLGFFYGELKSRTSKQVIKALGISLLCGLVICVLWQKQLYGMDMNFNKFQYNTIFLVYGILILSIIFVILPLFHKLYGIFQKKRGIQFLIAPYEKNSYTIFLFQAFVFIFIRQLIIYLNLYHLVVQHPYFSCLIYIIVALVLNSLVGRAMAWIETPF